VTLTAKPLTDDATGTFRLGDGGPTVRRLGFGAMRLTGAGVWGEPPDREAARQVVRRAVELGVNFIDTADSYGPDVSEEIIAEALHPYPADVVIATKGGLLRSGPGAWTRDGRPEHLRAACEGSLRRLRVDTIALYQLHAVDPGVPLEESLGTLVQLRDAGKVARIGVSNVDAAELERALAVTDVVTVQNRFNLADRASEGVLDACAQRGIGFIPWFPLATGALARPGGPLGAMAARHAATPAQVALAWLLARAPVMLPIPGTGSLDHLEQNVAAAQLRLDDADVRRLADAAG
jgi:aryl-alcohol dehydrogenase-like predicted oxidoreductase